MSLLSPSANRNQLAFRGLASLLIVLGHLLYIPHYGLGFADAADWGWAGKLIFFRFLAVDGFFALSGALLTLGYWEHFSKATPSRAIDRFYLKRIARIYPLHLLGVMVIGTYALLGIAHPIASGLQDGIMRHWEWTGVLNLLLMQGWGIVPVASWNEPSWTLSVLFMLYVIFPNLVIGIKRLPQTPWLMLALMVTLFGGYTALRVTGLLGASMSDGVGGIARGVALFGCGMLMARVQMLWLDASLRWHDKSKMWDHIAAASCVLMLGLMAAWWQATHFDLWPLQALMLVLVGCTLRADGAVARLLANRVTCWLGQISFALYIMHYPILMGLNYLAGDALPVLAMQEGWGKPLAYGLVMAVVIGLSAAVHRYIETPIERRLKSAL